MDSEGGDKDEDLDQNFKFKRITTAFILFVLFFYGIAIFFVARSMGWLGFVTLHGAAARGDLEYFRSWMGDPTNAPFDMSTKDFWGNAPVHYAVENG